MDYLWSSFVGPQVDIRHVLLIPTFLKNALSHLCLPCLPSSLPTPGFRSLFLATSWSLPFFIYASAECWSYYGLLNILLPRCTNSVSIIWATALNVNYMKTGLRIRNSLSYNRTHLASSSTFSSNVFSSGAISSAFHRSNSPSILQNSGPSKFNKWCQPETWGSGLDFLLRRELPLILKMALWLNWMLKDCSNLCSKMMGFCLHKNSKN